MKNLILLSITFLFIHCIQAQSIESKLQNAIDKIYTANPEAVGIMVHVEAPEQKISWSGASGFSNKTLKTKLHPNQPALIASSIKTYVAAATLRLVEKQLISLDDPIQDLVSPKTKQLFEDDGYDFSKITIKHLLSHTSGIKNYANLDYINDKDKRKKYRWTRDEQLKLATQIGDPLGAPGTIFSYADTNYLLLTEIMENMTKKPFYEAMKTLLRYKELGIKNTWFPTLEKKPKRTKELVHQYWSEYKWDSYDLDVSWDLYGGGGIACTTKDLAKFNYHFFNGNIVKDEAIKNLIFTEIRTKETELYPYYLGLSQDNYHGMNGFGHGGFWGTVMLHFPTINTSIAVYILDRDKRALRRDVLDALTKILKEEFDRKENLNTKITSYLNKITDFSGTILVAHKDEIIQQKAFGLANIEYNINNELNTQFNIASITKLFTAVATLQLFEQGKIKLDTPIGTYLPNYPNETVKNTVTIHQLLTHTSGLSAFYPNQYLKANPSSFKEVKDFLPLFVNDSLAFKPGEDYQYTASGFVILGLIIEQISGMNYYEYVDINIFKKAGMQQTTAIETDEIIKNKACGYTSFWGENEVLKRNDYYLSKASPGGFHYSTIHDLFLFSKALKNHTFINETTTNLMFQPKVKGYNTHLGYTIDIDRRYNERIVGHSGGWYGIRTELLDFLGSDYTIVVLSNIDDDGTTGASKVIEDLKKMIAGRKR